MEPQGLLLPQTALHLEAHVPPSQNWFNANGKAAVVKIDIIIDRSRGARLQTRGETAQQSESVGTNKLQLRKPCEPYR